MLTILLALKLGEKTAASWLSRYGVRPALSIGRKLREITFERECKRYGSKFVSGTNFVTKHTVTYHLGSLVRLAIANHLIWTETEHHGIVQTALDNYMKSRRKMKLGVGLETLDFNDDSLEPSSKTSRLDLDPNPSDSEAVTMGDSDVETCDPPLT
ncbi:uncharacterized protein LOC134195943 [Corticium candelabrum]|uniref:uncharacterized protein LOC134195943 n=1 Tax=Corticium candelabrum TaxID=121492 RepID=UPI002E26C550|nr:uncharacterized protein LOC134195943 [Corticium candelabrum]